jgi:hypothetical protein
MNKLKKLMSMVLTALLVITISIPAFAKSPESKDKSLKPDVEAFENQVREAGYEYAEKNGLLMSAADMEELKAMNSASSNKEKQDIYKKYEKYQISEKSIYDAKPDLKIKAQELQKKYPDTLNTISSEGLTSTSTPNIGDYRLNVTYSYSEETSYDSRTSGNYDLLATLTMNIFAIGFKGAQALAYAILSPIIGTGASSCTNYEEKSTYHDCLTVEWGQVYSSGGLFGTTQWLGFCESQRLDTYSKLQVDAWYQNVFKTNSHSELSKYQYNNHFNYTETYIKPTAIKLYNEQMKTNFSTLYGLLPIPEYNMSYEYSWTSSTFNGF